MSTVTFTRGANSVNVTGNVVYGTDFYDIRLNQYSQIMADGSTVTYDNGPTMCYGVLIMKGVSYTSGDAFRTWLKTYPILGYATFTIGAVVNADFGLGKNTALTSVYYDGGASTEGVFTFAVPGQYDIRFPYRFLRS